MIDAWNNQAAQAAQFETNLRTIADAGGQALADELRSQGPEVAGATADLIAHAGPAELGAAIDAHGRATGTAVARSVASGIRDDPTPLQALNSQITGMNRVQGPVIHPSIDLSDAEGKLSNFMRQQRTVTVGIIGRVGKAA
jgi:hypothetical protein